LQPAIFGGEKIKQSANIERPSSLAQDILRRCESWHAQCETAAAMKTSTQDKIEGTAKDLKGKVKEGAGKISNNERLQAEGRTDQIEGKVQKKVGDVKKVFEQ
jgi:uncharacterized protein YjbJ (UPF0337 family)